MVKRLNLATILAVWVFGVSHLDAQPIANATAPITVVLCDRAGISDALRTEARAITDGILQKAHIQLLWIDNKNCAGPELASYLSIIIVPERPKDFASSPGAMGRATMVETAHPRAYIFLDRVHRFDATNRATISSSNLGIILGHAITHELGHLMGLPHTPTGIMRAQWGHDEWKAAVSGTLLFSFPAARAAKLVR